MKGNHGEIEKAYRVEGDVVSVTTYWWASDPKPVEGHPVRRHTSYYQAGNSIAADHLISLLTKEDSNNGTD